MAAPDFRATSSPLGASASGIGALVEEDQPLDVVDEVDHADFRLGPSDADGADEEVHAILLDGEDVLDPRSDLRFPGIGVPDFIRHCVAGGFLPMDLADKAVLRQELLVGLGAIGDIGPDGACGVGLVEQAFADMRPVIGGGIGRIPPADQPEAAIDRDVILIAEGRDGDIDVRRAVLLRFGLAELDRPARIAVLVPELDRLTLPRRRHPAPSLIDFFRPRCCAAWVPPPGWHRRSGRPWRYSPLLAPPRQTARTIPRSRRPWSISRGTARSSGHRARDPPTPTRGTA